MIVSNLLFDIILFGTLLVAAVLDNLCPPLLGAASFLAVGVAAYVSSQELSDALSRRNYWTQESLATAVSLCTAGFIYYWWRTDSNSDFVLLVLSIGLMMASLMVAISVIAAIGAAWREQSGKPLAGLAVTFGGALGLGALAGLWTLMPLVCQTLVVVVGGVVWKLRETVRPPEPNSFSATAQPAEAAAERGAFATIEPPAPQPALAPSPALAPPPQGRLPLFPRRGTMMDRLVPVLVVGALVFMAWHEHVLPNLPPSMLPASAFSSTPAPGASSASSPAPPAAP